MKPIQINDFLTFKYISLLSYSPNKAVAAFFVAKAEEEKNEYHYQLYVLMSGKIKPLLKTKKRHHFVFEDDYHVLVQLEKTKEDRKKVENQWTIYYRLNIDTGALEKAYEFPFETTIEKVLKYQILLYSSLREEEHALIHLLDEQKRKEYGKKQKRNQAYELIEEIPFYFNGQGFTSKKRNQLFFYDKMTKTIQAILPPDLSVNETVVSAHLDQIFFSGNFATGVAKATSRLYKYDVIQGILFPLYEQDDINIQQIFLVDQHVIVAGSDMKAFGENQNPDFFIVQDGGLVPLAIYGNTLGNSMGSDVRLGGNKTSDIFQGKLYFVATVDDHTEIKSLDLAGQIQSEYSMRGSVDGLIFLENQLYLVGLYQQKLQEIYHLDVEKKTLKQISRLNQQALSKRYVAKPKPLVVKKPTYEVKGFVLLPQDYDQQKIYPTILDIHGGPKTVYGTVYYHEMQVWASKGYIVIFANPTGGDGKGDVFSDIRGHYGDVDYQDLMDFVDASIKKYPIDVNNLFVTGGSYGGFMTNWIIGHTQRFKAAATQRSIANWLSFYGTSDIGYSFAKDQTGGDPIHHLDKLWAQSPIKYLDNMQTPLLIIHSDMDYRCPIEQGMQLFTMLKQKGVSTRFVWFKGETHELSRSGKPQARVKRLSEITQWFDQYKEKR